jgi:hypothetical protein
VEPRVLFKFQFSDDVMMDFPTANPKLGVSAKIFEAFLEILRRKSQISIEFHQKIPVFPR